MSDSNDAEGSFVGPYRLPVPRFDDSAFEPLIDAETMRQHRALHRELVEHLNAALGRRPQWLGLTIERLMAGLQHLPADIRDDVTFFGGGHANHQFFWKVISPQRRALQPGEFAAAIAREFSSVEALQRRFEAAALALDGPGWAFLVSNPLADWRLEIIVLPDNGSVLPMGRMGLLVCDLWPHAHERHDPGTRADWLRRWWQLVDWDVVALRWQAFGRGPVAG